jgi:hypothetical protein
MMLMMYYNSLLLSNVYVLKDVVGASRLDPAVDLDLSVD